jgi:hypothetical protein
MGPLPSSESLPEIEKRIDFSDKGSELIAGEAGFDQAIQFEDDTTLPTNRG